MLKEFKKFISRGNVLDLAVAVIIGGAFGKIVTSLVNDILMPLIGVILGGHDFTTLIWTVGESQIMYGVFIQNIIDFLIISLSIFVFIKIITKFNPPKKEEVKAPVKSDEVVLLEQIRDLLKNKK